MDETECIYDYLATGRERIASATRQAIQEYEAVKENIEPGEISYSGVWNYHRKYRTRCVLYKTNVDLTHNIEDHNFDILNKLWLC